MFIIQNTIDRKTSWAEVGKQCTTLQKQMYKYALCVQFCDLRTPCGSVYLMSVKGEHRGSNNTVVLKVYYIFTFHELHS